MSATVNIEATGVGKTIKDIKSVESALEHMGNKARSSMKYLDGGGVGGRDVGFKNMGGAAGGRQSRQKNMGFALLSASQAFEDFSMAGMKGVLNNIPQMMMFAGASATMTAAVSVLAVSLSVVGPHLFTVSKALDAATEAGKRAEAFAFALKDVNDAMFDFDLSKWSQNQIKDAEESMDSLTKSILRPREALDEFGKRLDAFASKNEILRNIAEKTNELFAPKDGAQSRGAVFERGSMQNELIVAQKKLKETQDAIGRLESRIPFISNKNIGKMSDEEYRGAFQEATSASAFAKNNLEEAKKSADALEKSLKGGVNSALSGMAEAARGYMGGGGNNSFVAQDKRIADEKAKVNIAKQAVDEAEKNLKMLQAQKEVQDKYGSNYEKVLEAARKERDALGEANRLAREAVAFEEQKLAAQEKYIAGLKVVAAEENLRKVMESNLNNMPSASVFLSDKGRIGLGGDQYKNAMGVINYQRQANSLLTQIARNTLNAARGNMNAVWAK